MAMVDIVDPKVGSRLALFCIRHMNRLNSHNDSRVMISAP